MRSRGLVVALVGLLGCHAAPRGAEAPSNHGSAPAGQSKPGTSGFAALDWGATAAQVLAAYPTASRGGAIALHGSHEGRAATITFVLDGAGGTLGSIAVTFDDAFLSMDACSKTWTPMRASLDARLGASQADNLAAYWHSATATITLACDPTDDGRATLGMRYEPAAAE